MEYCCCCVVVVREREELLLQARLLTHTRGLHGVGREGPCLGCERVSSNTSSSSAFSPASPRFVISPPKAAVPGTIHREWGDKDGRAGDWKTWEGRRATSTSSSRDQHCRTRTSSCLFLSLSPVPWPPLPEMGPRHAKSLLFGLPSPLFPWHSGSLNHSDIGSSSSSCISLTSPTAWCCCLTSIMKALYEWNCPLMPSSSSPLDTGSIEVSLSSTSRSHSRTSSWIWQKVS